MKSYFELLVLLRVGSVVMSFFLPCAIFCAAIYFLVQGISNKGQTRKKLFAFAFFLFMGFILTYLIFLGEHI
jgi:hypothetical protein